jgi:hypothetical protein
MGQIHRPSERISPYAYADEKTVFQGFSYTAQPGALNIYDEPIGNQLVYIQGGKLWVKQPNLGDYAELSVVDKDNVLGLFDQYGLVEGTDVLEVSKWVRKLHTPPWNWECELFAKTAGSVAPGLYLRVAYENTGTSAVDFGVFYLWYES